MKTRNPEPGRNTSTRNSSKNSVRSESLKSESRDPVRRSLGRISHWISIFLTPFDNSLHSSAILTNSSLCQSLEIRGWAHLTIITRTLLLTLGILGARMQPLRWGQLRKARIRTLWHWTQPLLQTGRETSIGLMG